MVKFKIIKTGKRKILIRFFLILFFFISFEEYLISQEREGDVVEYKAIKYFCNNIDSIIPGLEISNMRFSGKTKASPSNVFNIADCIGEINLLKDSIPNETFIDSLDQAFSTINYPEIKIGRMCFRSTNWLFDLFNKSVYTLNLFNSVKYNGSTYVELYLINKKQRAYIVVLEFNDQTNNIISHFVKSRIY